MPNLDKISDFLDHYAETTPDTTATILGDEQLSYRALSQRVDLLSKALISAGAKKGDRIATLSEPNPDFLVTFLASISLGLIWVGLNPRYRQEEYRHNLEDSSPKFLFYQQVCDGRNYTNDIKLLKSNVRSIETVIVFEGFQASDNEFNYSDFVSQGDDVTSHTLMTHRANVSKNDPALLVYTSGTSGKPKGAVLPHRGLVKCALTQNEEWAADPIRLINFLPINHIACVGDASCYALVGGGTIIFQPKFDPRNTLELIQKHKITVWGGVPTTLQLVLSDPDLDKYDLSSIQMILWSGARASQDLAKRLLNVCSKLSVSYGLTETVGSVTYVPLCDDISLLTNSIGRAPQGFEVRVAGENNSEAEIDVEGEILVRGDFIMLGYWNNETSTNETIDQEGWLHTGDIGARKSNGYLELKGRMSDMYKSGGYNIYPKEIEDTLLTHPNIEMAAIVGIPNELYGEIGHAYIVQTQDATIDLNDLNAFCTKRMANYKVPKEFHIVNNLPLLPVGKVDKVALKEQALSLRNESNMGSFQ